MIHNTDGSLQKLSIADYGIRQEHSPSDSCLLRLPIMHCLKAQCCVSEPSNQPRQICNVGGCACRRPTSSLLSRRPRRCSLRWILLWTFDVVHYLTLCAMESNEILTMSIYHAVVRVSNMAASRCVFQKLESGAMPLTVLCSFSLQPTSLGMK